jgi:diguanylate cyclase
MSRSGRTPDAAPDLDHQDQALTELSRLWTREITRKTFVPGPRGRVRATLEALLGRLRGAVLAEPFDPTSGYRIGVDLVEARMATPPVLGVSLELLSQELLPAIGATDDAAGARLAVLLGQLATGFTATLRDRAMDAAEDINRAERGAWRQQQFAMRQRLQHAHLHDPMTGLGNRIWFTDQLDHLLAGARPEERVGVAVLSVPQVAAVNQTLGPDMGDHLLQRVGLHLRLVAAGHGYLVGYLGGAEFALAIPRTADREQLVKAADQILRTLPPFAVDRHRFPGTAKAGLVECPAAGAEPAELLRAASIALAWAVAEPRSAYAVFDAGRGDTEILRHQLTMAMPGALEREQFYLDYQPLIRLGDNRVIGVEALARWGHPVFGPQHPADFIPLAEQTGLIEPLGLYLLERACREAAAWRRDRLLVSVNLSPIQLAGPGLAATVATILDRTGHPAELLQLEITESGSLDEHHGVLTELANLGVRLAVDDFGTGHTNLVALRKLPVRTVKLAAQFLRDITDPAGTRDAVIVSHLIPMCHELGMQVIAEGIETGAQARHLATLGCDIGQGFHLALPTTPHAITRMLAG